MSVAVSTEHPMGRDRLHLLVRCLLGGIFVYMGLSKALHPVDFLKLVRQYEIVQTPVLLNFIAAILPWFEVYVGIVLMTGFATRGAALIALGMLIPFTAAIFMRALAIHQAEGTPFCAIRFDCGCGTGERVICHKLWENGALIVFSLVLLLRRRRGVVRFSHS